MWRCHGRKRCRVSSRLKWCKNYINRLRLATVIVQNKMSRFLWFIIIIIINEFHRDASLTKTSLHKQCNARWNSDQSADVFENSLRKQHFWPWNWPRHLESISPWRWPWSFCICPCSFCALTLLLGSFDPSKLVPDMTYNVYGGTLNLTQSILTHTLRVLLQPRIHHGINLSSIFWVWETPVIIVLRMLAKSVDGRRDWVVGQCCCCCGWVHGDVTTARVISLFEGRDWLVRRWMRRQGVCVAIDPFALHMNFSGSCTSTAAAAEAPTSPTTLL